LEIAFVLASPQVPENIGSAARALGVMGFSELHLVNPISFPDERARWMACSFEALIDKASVHTSLSAALSSFDLAVGTTSRERSIFSEYLSPRELKTNLASKGTAVKRAAIVFGPENSGLTNEELSLCSIASRIQTVEQKPCLNLAQAVMVYAYELSSFGSRQDVDGLLSQTPSKEETDPLRSKLSLVLDRLSIPAQTPLYRRVMECTGFLSERDIRLIHHLSDRLLALEK